MMMLSSEGLFEVNGCGRWSCNCGREVDATQRKSHCGSQTLKIRVGALPGLLHGYRLPHMTVPRPEPAIPALLCSADAFAHGER